MLQSEIQTLRRANVKGGEIRGSGHEVELMRAAGRPPDSPVGVSAASARKQELELLDAQIALPKGTNYLGKEDDF